ncbi:hypothetical protein Sjap_008239 [Stephania japonica]|uniref:Chlororespiratory reduction 4 n=1 Tax=Stephania japonica TaxID=461633 RepID=A0AAP0JPY4_9MAGN
MVHNSLIDMYAKSEEIRVARKVFDGMSQRDVVSWNSMISCYGNNYEVNAARELFDIMPDRNVVSWTAMLCGYAKTGNMVEAQILFDKMPIRDMASWKVMISGYMDVGNFSVACCTFNEMPSRDIGSWNIMISGLCKARRLDFAIELFDRMPSRNGASWCIMIDGYVKAGDVDNARLLFDRMNEKNLVSWSTMIAGYAKNGQASHALELFNQFKHLGIEPDETFIITIISVCSQLGILDIAEAIVSNYVQCTHFSNLHLVTSLIDMYSKCGSVERSLQVFEKVDKKDLFCYSAMIAAFANHGRGQEAITLFHEMLSHNIKPDGVAFLGILTACNHGGLVYEGKKWFELMRKEFDVPPLEKHYACLVDLLGRAGCLNDAYEVIKNMPMEPHSVVWGSFLSACRAHRNVELAEVAASWLFEIEPDNSGNYILLSTIYAAAGRWDDVAKVRTLLRKRGVRKNRGSSWIELDHVVHEFVMGDVSHVDSGNIYVVLNLILGDMQTLGT